MKNQRWRSTLYFVVLATMVIILFLYLGLWKDPQKEMPIVKEGQEVRKDRDPPKTDLSKEPKFPQYDMKLKFDPEHKTLAGTTRIQVWNRADQPTREMNIHLFLNAFGQDKDLPVLPQFVKKAYPSGVRYGKLEMNKVEVTGQKITYKTVGTRLQIGLQEEWKPREKIEIVLQWTATVPEIYHRVGMKEGAYWFGNALPILAVYNNKWKVYDYEVVGDPFFSEVADYTVEIITPATYHVFATGDETDMLEQNLRTTRIEAKQVREFAFAVSPNHQVQSAETKDGKKVKIYYRYADESQVKATLKKAVGMLEYMEQRVGAYPYPEIDIFENEMFITGMEYPGIVFIQSKRLNSPTGDQTVLHEIAHQWFYNIVGNDQISEPWLDEGMATYFTDEFLKKGQLEKYYAAELKSLNNKNPGLRIQEVQAYDDWSTYWRGNYRKSSLMIFTVRQKLGEDAFAQFLKDYVKAYQYDIVTTEEFIQFTGQYTNEDLTEFFDEWFGKRAN